MSELIFSTIIPALVTLVFGSVATYLGTRWKIRSELEAEYDRSLRDDRIAVYQELWKELQPLAKYVRPGPVTYETIHDLSINLRQWYFERGGLYLSEGTRDQYFALQDTCQEVLSNPKWKAEQGAELDEETFEALRGKGSALRTSMARDVGTRKGAILEVD